MIEASWFLSRFFEGHLSTPVGLPVSGTGQRHNASRLGYGLASVFCGKAVQGGAEETRA
jgi:hypothetical protein